MSMITYSALFSSKRAEVPLEIVVKAPDKLVSYSAKRCPAGSTLVVQSECSISNFNVKENKIFNNYLLAPYISAQKKPKKF